MLHRCCCTSRKYRSPRNKTLRLVGIALSAAIVSHLFALSKVLEFQTPGLEVPADQRQVGQNPESATNQPPSQLLVEDKSRKDATEALATADRRQSDQKPERVTKQTLLPFLVEDERQRAASSTDSRSPVASMFNHFPNHAVAREIHKHDRWIVDSLAYLSSFDDSQAARYSGNVMSTKLITIVVLTINRDVPYLAVLVAMLLRGHSPDAFMARLNVHIVNIERRPGKSNYFLFNDLQRKLPFITFHNWTSSYEQYSRITDSKKWYLANQRIDYIRALRICKNADSPWCVVFEDDAVPCVQFAHKFDEYVNKEEYSVRGIRLATKPKSPTGGTRRRRLKAVAVSIATSAKTAFNNPKKVRKDQVAMVKLYTPFNNGHAKGTDGDRDVFLERYAREGYDKDRAMDLVEANATGNVVKKVVYNHIYSSHWYGAVAEAIPSAVLEQLIGDLSKGDSKGDPEKVKALDISLSSDFIRHSHLDRIEMSPSLVNHIGYISEHMRDAGMFERISTDVRFQLDDGYEARDKAQDPLARVAAYNSPVLSMSTHFPNHAVEREIHKHDRWIVDSLAYLNNFDQAQAAKYTDSAQTSAKSNIAIVVLTMNRALPYLAVLLAVLLRGHKPGLFMELLDVHVVNIDRRPGKRNYSFLEDLQSKLPFITFHNWTVEYELHSNTIDSKIRWVANQRLDYIRALGLCKDAGSRWCVVLEDDAVPCVGFAHKFDEYVNKDKYDVGGVSPTSLGGQSHAANQTEEISIDKVGMVKLYVPFNDGHNKGERDILLEEYARERYDRDRALDLLEAKAAGVSAEKVVYQMKHSSVPYGAVAEAYPAGVLDRIIGYLSKKETTKDVPGKLNLRSRNTQMNKAYVRDVVRPVDISIGFNFFRDSNLKRLEISPSLVNHIGHMSEHRSREGLFSRVSTDVRFQLDDNGP